MSREGWSVERSVSTRMYILTYHTRRSDGARGGGEDSTLDLAPQPRKKNLLWQRYKLILFPPQKALQKKSSNPLTHCLKASSKHTHTNTHTVTHHWPLLWSVLHCLRADLCIGVCVWGGGGNQCPTASSPPHPHPKSPARPSNGELIRTTHQSSSSSSWSPAQCFDAGGPGLTLPTPGV